MFPFSPLYLIWFVLQRKDRGRSCKCVAEESGALAATALFTLI
jgi:hypothetical protein